MFIVWGTKKVERNLGWVADYCPICNDTRTFRLIEMRMVSHIYYLPLGRGRPAGHVRWCKQCKYMQVSDPEKYSGTLKKNNVPIEDLTDQTNPGLVDTMVDILEMRDRAERGELSDNERRDMMLQQFKSIVIPVAKRKERIHIDGASCLWLLGVIVFPIVALFICDSLPASMTYIGMSSQIAIGVAIITAIGLVHSVVFDSRRYAHRKFGGMIATRLTPLNPSLEEIDEVLEHLEQDASTRTVGKAFCPLKLRTQITRHRENRSAGNLG